jgi:hypothetical protein
MTRRTSPNPLILLLISAGLLQCSAEGIPAPVPRVEEPAACGSLEERMPEFFRMLRDPTQPLAGLRTVVEALAADDPGALKGNLVGRVLKHAVVGLKEFTDDPGEIDPNRPTSCLTVPPPHAPLCRIEAPAGEVCESRLCAIRRALDFGLRDAAAKPAIDALRPVLVKLLRYIAGSDGTAHLEGVRVLNASSRAEALCSPANLVELIDHVFLYFRADPECFAARSCVSFKALAALRSLLSDPTFDDFLKSFESAQSGGKGRAGFQQLGAVLLNAIANTPEDEHYFDQIQTVADTVLGFLSEPKWDGLRPKVETAVALLRGLLDPDRPYALLRTTKAVAACLASPAVDPNMDLVGAIYDLVARPDGAPGGGVDLLELVGALEGITNSDPNGVLVGALHTVLRTLRDDEEALEAVRLLLIETLTDENARLLLPSLVKMVELRPSTPGGVPDHSVLDELISLVDSVVYGCSGSPR